MSPVRAIVLVDGSNVARCASWRAMAGPGPDADHELRQRLLDAICSWAARTEHEVVVAFDGAGPWGAGVLRVTPQVEVEGSGSRDGDDVLEARAASARGAQRAYWLVTSDRAIRQVAGYGANRVIDSDAYVQELRSVPADAPDAAVEQDASPSRLDAVLDDDVRAKLERMRRGEA